MSQANSNLQNDLATTFPVTNETLREDCRPDENAANTSSSSPGEETLTSETGQASFGHTNLKPSLPVSPRNKKRQRSDNNRATGKLFADDFFIPILGDLFNDIQERKLTPLEFFVLAMLLRQVDFNTGIWTGSACWIQVGSGGQLNPRTIQSVMNSLGEKRVIKSFHRRGQRNDFLCFCEEAGKKAGEV